MEKWQEPETLILWLSISLLVITSFALAIIVFTRLYFKRILKSKALLIETKLEHQKVLTHISIEILERERSRIALELHDALINKLNVILLIFSSRDLEKHFENSIVECISLTRQLSHNLKPPFIEELSLYELLKSLFLPLKSSYQVGYTLLRYNTNITLLSEQKLHLLRVVQEIINNIIKHAQATEIYFYLRISNTTTALKISDNGVGFDTLKIQGLGLQNIELRLQILNGVYKFKSNQKGTTFIACAPLTQE
ncbi:MULTISPECIES: sensor histidine kinase [Aquimarina]|uniref:histidine kinase n=1 Tax=Aquimarina algiphila TaxID=2047982 RepID=A0A554VB48_9FLAO|nr:MULTISPECIES: ATP-binding protein [Aquimarina]TSE03532.1 hypothetical protein FOF46_29030 [Aquimarina algiphila]